MRYTLVYQRRSPTHRRPSCARPESATRRRHRRRSNRHDHARGGRSGRTASALVHLCPQESGSAQAGQTSRAMAAWIAGAMLWQLVRAARGPTMFGRAVGTTGAHGTLCVVVFFQVNATCPHSGTSRRPPREGILPSWKRSDDIVQSATVRAVPTAGLAGVIDSRHREPHRRSQSVSKSRPLSPWPPRPTW